jgi:hypothetical protein
MVKKRLKKPLNNRKKNLDNGQRISKLRHPNKLRKVQNYMNSKKILKKKLVNLVNKLNKNRMK